MKGQPRPVSESDYLRHILEAINRIQKYVGSLTYEDFISDTREQDAVIRNFEVVGEASPKHRASLSRLRHRTPRVVDTGRLRYAQRSFAWAILVSTLRLSGGQFTRVCLP